MNHPEQTDWSRVGDLFETATRALADAAKELNHCGAPTVDKTLRLISNINKVHYGHLEKLAEDRWSELHHGKGVVTWP